MISISVHQNCTHIAVLPTGCGTDVGLASRGWNSIWKYKDYCYESPTLFYFNLLSLFFSISPPFLSPSHFLLFTDTLDLCRRLVTHIHKTSLWVRERKEHKCYMQLLVGKCPLMPLQKLKILLRFSGSKNHLDTEATFEKLWTSLPFVTKYQTGI